MSFDNFRRYAVEERAKDRERGSNFTPWEMEELSLSVGDTVPLRFLAPEDGRAFNYYYHWPKGGRPHTCTRDLTGFDGKCLYCYMAEEAKKGGQDVQYYQRGSRVLEIIDFRFLHIVSEKRNDGRTVKTLKACEHQTPNLPSRVRCRYCQDNNPETAKRHFGGHKILQLNRTMFQSVVALNEHLNNICVHVKEDGSICGGEAYVSAYICGNCGFEFITEDIPAKIIDGWPRRIADLTAQQVDMIRDNPQVCPQCQHDDFPRQLRVCENGASTDGHGAVPGEIFFKRLVVSVAGESKSRRDGSTYTERTFNFDTGAPFSSVFDDLLKLGFSEVDVEALLKPWDLNERFAPEEIKREQYATENEYVAAVLQAQTKVMSDYTKSQVQLPDGWLQNTMTQPFGGARGNRGFRAH